MALNMATQPYLINQVEVLVEDDNVRWL